MGRQQPIQSSCEFHISSPVPCNPVPVSLVHRAPRFAPLVCDRIYVVFCIIHELEYEESMPLAVFLVSSCGMSPRLTRTPARKPFVTYLGRYKVGNLGLYQLVTS